MAYVRWRAPVVYIIPYWHFKAETAFVGGCKRDCLSVVRIQYALLIGFCQLRCMRDGWAIVIVILTFKCADDDVGIVGLVLSAVVPILLNI